MSERHSHNQQTPHPHDPDSDHTHNHDDHDHEHDHNKGVWGWITGMFHSHHHDHTALASDQSFAESDGAIRTVWLALAALAATTLLQMVIVWLSGSVALLADTVHNLGDMLNSVPLLIAFYLARRKPSRRYNYGYSRAEDVAGIFIVLSIAVSAGLIFWESISKLIHPEPLAQPLWVAAAALIGFVGNEAVAILQIRKGEEIGSAALKADGQHARTDGLTSLAVLIAVAGYWFDMPILDPLVGLTIGFAILFITKDASLTMWYRLMDAIEPELLDKAESTVESVADVQEVRRVRMRWVGHRLHAEAHIAVDAALSTAESHQIAEDVRHALFHAMPRLFEVIVHVEPWASSGKGFHQQTEHHEAQPGKLPA